jgi:hypothetical protein
MPSSGGNSRARHFRIDENEIPKLLKILEALQTGIGYLGVAKVQLLELGQVIKMFQTGIRHLGIPEEQFLEFRQMRRPRIDGCPAGAG